MAIADLNLSDVRRILSIRHDVKLTEAEASAFLRAGTTLALGALGGEPPRWEDLLAPIERVRVTLVQRFGEPYTKHLIERLRR